MRRAISDAALTVGGALVLVLALVMFDARIREKVHSAFDTRHPGAMLADLGQRGTEAVTIIAAAARHQSFEHAPLLIFAAAASVLVVCMLRT